MKKLLLSLALIIGINTINAQTKAPSPTQKQNTVQSSDVSDATIDFQSKVVDYGVIENKSDLLFFL